MRNKTKQIRLTMSQEMYKRVKEISPLQNQIHFVIDSILRQYFEERDRKESAK